MRNIDDIAEKIISKNIGKADAINQFEELSESDKNRLLLKLRERMVSTSRDQSIRKKIAKLKTIDEKNFTAEHHTFIQKLKADYEKFAPKSKDNALKHQQYFVDARKVANLKKSIKELQFHITYDTANGAYLYDIDGNKYIDVTGDNGVNIFGSQPEFVTDSIKNRLAKGYPLVGYTEELFEAAKLFCDITGNERVAFTQSGTEAVMWAVRIARAATQRTKIVIFEGSYHGLSDTVGAIKDHEGASLSAGLGIPQEYADQIIVLDYGNEEQLDIIERRADEIAAVLVEPVQASRPQLQPAEFLKELRKLTLEKNILLIFDEMITGFRACPKGAQGHFNIKADIATYGKVPGGGMPTGMIAGLAKYMDFIDGGKWNFEDDSMPKLKRVYIGGTHTRNPLKISASLAVLRELKNRCSASQRCDNCSCFQKKINDLTKFMADSLNALFAKRNVPITVDYFSSLFKFRFTHNPSGLVKELFLVLLRMHGVETSVSGNFFLTDAHTREDIDNIISAVETSVSLLLDNGFFCEDDSTDIEPQEQLGIPAKPPVQTEKLENIHSQLEKLKSLIKADLKNFQKEGA